MFLTYISYINILYDFTDLAFNRLNLIIVRICISIHNIDHTVSEYQLLYGRLAYIILLSHSGRMKMLSLCFRFEKQTFS
jgi:hypothetical protein